MQSAEDDITTLNPQWNRAEAVARLPEVTSYRSMELTDIVTAAITDDDW